MFCLLAQTVVVTVTLPMTKVAFLADQDKYIASVAATANVSPDNVQILSVDEVSARRIARRLLLATSVRVQTSVLLASGQAAAVQDQSLLNANLKKNRPPNGEFAVQNSAAISALLQTTSSPAAGLTPSPAIIVSIGAAATTPAPSDSRSGTAASTPIGVIVGAAVGIVVVLVGCSLGYLYRRKSKPAPAPDSDPKTKTGSRYQTTSSNQSSSWPCYYILSRSRATREATCWSSWAARS